MLNHEELANAAVLIYANKQDVKDCMSAAEISRHLDLTSIKNQQWHIQSCCALTGEGYVFITNQIFKVLKPVYTLPIECFFLIRVDLSVSVSPQLISEYVTLTNRHRKI